jgi:hypothetical protein
VVKWEHIQKRWMVSISVSSGQSDEVPTVTAAPQTKMAREREWTHPCPFQSSTNPKDDYRVYHKLPVHVPLVTA